MNDKAKLVLTTGIVVLFIVLTCIALTLGAQAKTKASDSIESRALQPNTVSRIDEDTFYIGNDGSKTMLTCDGDGKEDTCLSTVPPQVKFSYQTEKQTTNDGESKTGMNVSLTIDSKPFDTSCLALTAAGNVVQFSCLVTPQTN